MYYQQYFQALSNTLDTIFSQEAQRVEAAGAILAETLKKDGLLYVFGSGHSHMLAEELFYRAGGLAPVYPIFDTAAMLHEGAAKSSGLERMTGYARHLMARYPIGPGDCFLIVSNSGINPMPMEMAEEAKKRGAAVIGISSLIYRNNPSRHPEGKHLPDFCDICLDNHVPIGDATVPVCSDGTKAGPVSSAAAIALANAIVLHACELLNRDGIDPKVFRSSNTPGADGYNAALIRDFSPRIRNL